MEIEEAIRCVVDGDGILFVGAGLSFLAKTKEQKRVPDGRALVDLLLEQPIGTGSKHRLDRLAGSVTRTKGVDFVYDILKSYFVVASVDQKLKTLYGLPWKRIYSTNYDDAVEVARKGLHRISSVTIDEPQGNTAIGSVVHLNGFINRISPPNIETGLLLTDASYAASRLVSTGWLSFFENDIRTARTIIFAGYSLYDLEIDQALLSVEMLSRRAFFYISPHADEVETGTLMRYGRVVPGGIDALISKIDEVTKDYRAPKFVGGFTSLREVAPLKEHQQTSTSAQILFQQLVYGYLPEQEILTAARVFGEQTYLAIREQDKAARTAIKQGPWRDILFVGEIASGKSASTLTLAAFLREIGYRIYYAQESTLLDSDLQRLSQSEEKVAVIFDGYSKYRKEITDYVARRRPTHRLVLTERSAVHEFINDFTTRTPHLGPIYEIALDKIVATDAPAFEALTNFGGFWGEGSGASVASRQRRITDELEGSLYRLLVEIIKSRKVQKEISDLLKPLSYDRQASKVFCSALIINKLGFNFTISEWQYLFDRQLVRRMLNNYADQVRHFIFSDTDRIYMRNGVLSSHILHAFLDDDLVRECLVDIGDRAQRTSATHDIWSRLRIELMKFSSVEPMFSGPNKAQNIFGYYDAIRAFGEVRNNSDYWLQLGIAATVLEDLPRAQHCFENAYAREKAKRNPNLTRIDNYFSRFQMRLAVTESDPNLAFGTFIKANERLEKQIFLDINRHYPFKTGRHFADIAARHYEAWNENQKGRFREAAMKIRRKAEEWKSTNRTFSADVEILIRETSDLLKRIGN